MENNHTEKNDSEIENSYIMREYFKSFKLENSEANKVRDKINKTDRNLILDSIIKQNNEIYYLIAKNYSNSIDIFQKISDQINKLNELSLNSTLNDNSIPLYSIRSTCSDDDNISNSNSFEKEPFSLLKINSTIEENLNTIQQLHNDIRAKTNVVENFLNQIKDDETLLIELQSEKSLYIENICEETLKHICESGFNYAYQYKLVKFLLEHVITSSLICEKFDDVSINEMTWEEILNNEKIKVKIFKEFRRIIYNIRIEGFRKKLISSQEEFLKSTQDKLRELGGVLDSIKLEAEKQGKDIIYENFLYPLFKSLKLIIFISISKNRNIVILDSIEKERDQIHQINEKVKEVTQKNSLYEKLRNDIKKKYEISTSSFKDKDSANNNLFNSNSSILSGNSNKSLKKIKSKTNIPDVSISETKTNLKVLHSNLENNYMSLLKSLSKKILRPKDLLKKADSNSLSYKIK